MPSHATLNRESIQRKPPSYSASGCFRLIPRLIHAAPDLRRLLQFVIELFEILDFRLEKLLGFCGGFRLRRLLTSALTKDLRDIGGSAAIPCEDLPSVSALLVEERSLATYVLSILRHVSQASHGGDGEEILFELFGCDFGDGKRRILRRLQRKEIGQETRNVRGGHRCT